MAVSKKDIETLTETSFEILKKNRRTTDGHAYTVPSPETYPYQWLWDSCFHAIVLSLRDPEAAKEELRSLVSRQFGSGLIPHIIYWVKTDRINIDWGVEGTSSITQPPLLAYAVWRVYEQDADKAFLEEMYPPLYHYYNFLLSDRDPRHNNLSGIINPDESGEDNSPRFDTLIGLPPAQTKEENLKNRIELVKRNKSCNFDAAFCMKKFFWVKDVPFNTILIHSLGFLANIAEELDRKDDSLYFGEQKLRVTDAMRDRLLDGEVFWSAEGKNYEKIKVKTWALFAPLFANVATQEEASYTVRTYLENEHEFKTSYLIPTVSQSEPSYDPEGYWRGPVWIATNWLVYNGLRKYRGFEHIAEAVRESSAKLLLKSGFREYFNPETGAGLGATQFTWGSLIVDMYRGA